MIKSYKIRIYPTKEQEQHLWKHVGSCRYIWNYMLEKQEESYKNGEKYLSGFSMAKMLTPLKNDGEHDWLYEVSNKSLQAICRDLDKAYKSLFKNVSRHPKFKSRKNSKASYPVNCESFYFKDEKVLNVEKVGKIKYKTDFTFPVGRNKVKFNNVRITYVNNKWIISFGVEYENQVYELNDKSVGIDLGVKELAVVAFDEESLVFHNINKSKKMKKLSKKLKHLQRGISRKYEVNRIGQKYKKTNNVMKEEMKLRKIHTRIANIRNNYIHQTRFSTGFSVYVYVKWTLQTFNRLLCWLASVAIRNNGA